ncbi:MAG: DUF2442 domain-containing protein [Bacteroidales bacterium]|nr:DUF2442 domain-containing protein [Bacteroidales bacterium]
MERILKIWFDGEWLYGHGDDGKIYRQSLLWYKSLMNASSGERQKYVFSGEGIHWRELDTDVSYESFLYPEAEPSDLQRFFLTHPEINIAGFAERAGINASLLRNYINGFKNPSPETVLRIKTCLHSIGKEYLDADF